MKIRFAMALCLLLAAMTASAQSLMCDRRQGWTMDGEHCPRCNILLAGSVARKQSFGVCLNCSSGCPYEKALPLEPPDVTGKQTANPLAIRTCGMLTPPPKILSDGEQMPIAIQLDAAAIEKISRRYPIAATFVALMSSHANVPNIFDANSITMGIRHRPIAETAVAFIERGDAAMQAPFVSELPLLEQVLVEARGERTPSGDIELWVLSSLETRTETRVIEGPVRVTLQDRGERATTSVGNIGVIAPVMTLVGID